MSGLGKEVGDVLKPFLGALPQSPPPVKESSKEGGSTMNIPSTFDEAGLEDKIPADLSLLPSDPPPSSGHGTFTSSAACTDSEVPLLIPAESLVLIQPSPKKGKTLGPRIFEVEMQ